MRQQRRQDPKGNVSDTASANLKKLPKRNETQSLLDTSRAGGGWRKQNENENKTETEKHRYDSEKEVKHRDGGENNRGKTKTNTEGG